MSVEYDELTFDLATSKQLGKDLRDLGGTTRKTFNASRNVLQAAHIVETTRDAQPSSLRRRKIYPLVGTHALSRINHLWGNRATLVIEEGLSQADPHSYGLPPSKILITFNKETRDVTKIARIDYFADYRLKKTTLWEAKMMKREWS